MFVNQGAWDDLDDATRSVVNGCASPAEYAGTWRAVHCTEFTLGELTKNGMVVQRAGETLQEELREIGVIMTNEWLRNSGETGKAVVDAFHGRNQRPPAPGSGGSDRRAASCGQELESDIGRNPLRRALDRLYLLCGHFAAFCLIAILSFVIMQMVAGRTGEILPGTSDHAGYFMASSTFFAFAYALNNGSHIRVNMLLNAMGGKRRWGELWCLAVASALSVFWAYYAIKTVYWSYRLGDISQGLDATPIWIPQLAMAAGSVVFSISLVDNLMRVVLFGTHSAH